MTLVLSAGTHKFLVQVSDRRLTRQTGAVVTDDAIKAVAYCNFMAIAYTGLARIGGERTDLWITRQLQAIENPSPGQVAGKLREAAEGALEELPSPFPHAFVGIGWLSEAAEAGGDLHPFIAKVSNFHDEDGAALTDARREFSARISYTTRRDRFALDVTGQSLASEEVNSLARTIRRALKRGGGQRAVMRLLARAIRDAADRNQRVGRDLLGTCYAVEATKQDPFQPSWIIKGDPRETDHSFHDLRDGNLSGTRYQPHIVGPGFRLTDGRLEGPTAPTDANPMD